MNFISIDIETTGIDPERDQILEFGAIIVQDWRILGSFRKTIYHNRIEGDAFALHMNQNLLKEIAHHNNKSENDRICTIEDLPYEFSSYLLLNNFYKLKDGVIHFNAAGKNFGSFDYQFLKRISTWNSFFRVAHRIIDVAPLYFDKNIDLDKLPNLEQCKERSGLFKESAVSHNAEEDARDVAMLVIDKLGK